MPPDHVELLAVPDEALLAEVPDEELSLERIAMIAALML